MLKIGGKLHKTYLLLHSCNCDIVIVSRQRSYTIKLIPIMRISPAIEKVLEILQGGAESTVGLFDAMTSGRAESYRKARRYQNSPLRFKTHWADAYRDSQKFYSLFVRRVGNQRRSYR